MHGKNHIIELYWIDSLLVSRKILGLNGWHPVKANIEKTVEEESDDIEAQKVKTQSDHTEKKSNPDLF